MPFSVSLNTPHGSQDVSFEVGDTLTFCGANGSGKTRLAVEIEQQLAHNAHRLSAHRALSLNPRVTKISEMEALSGLRTGNPNSFRKSNSVRDRAGSRWQGKEAVLLLNDFDYLLQALFADQSNTALKSHKQLRSRQSGTAEETKFEKLSKVWRRVLPHRDLDIDGDEINVRIRRSQDTYPASEMSDGERAAFYLIGQTLAASKGSVLIVDEPELHLHPSITTALWDELATARPDCAFVFITHSLEFAAERPGKKFVLTKFDMPSTWSVEPIPDDTGFNEAFTSLMLGSRRPVLFVEGSKSSLDHAIYRVAYPQHLVVPRESCEAVIHAVSTMRRNVGLFHTKCYGIVDRDSRAVKEPERLTTLGIAVLPVAEIENLILLPDVSRAIVVQDGYRGEQVTERLTKLQEAVLARASAEGEVEAAAIRYAKRQSTARSRSSI